MVAASLSSAGSMTQVRSASAWLIPAATSADSRPPGLRLAVRALLVMAVHAVWCGWSISGKSQEMFTGRARPAARWPGQNGSKVWAEVSTSPVKVSASWAATGYTPNALMPSALTLKDALQLALAPGFRLAAITNGEPAETSTVLVPWARK